jgi:hypothetical protein
MYFLEDQVSLVWAVGPSRRARRAAPVAPRPARRARRAAPMAARVRKSVLKRPCARGGKSTRRRARAYDKTPAEQRLDGIRRDNPRARGGYKEREQQRRAAGKCKRFACDLCKSTWDSRAAMLRHRDNGKCKRAGASLDVSGFNGRTWQAVKRSLGSRIPVFVKFLRKAQGLTRDALGAPVWFQSFPYPADAQRAPCLDVAVLLAELRRVGCCEGPLPPLAPAGENQLVLRSVATAVAAVIMRTDLWIRCVGLVPVPWEDTYERRFLGRLLETWKKGLQLANCRVQICRSRSIRHAKNELVATQKACFLVSAVRGVAERVGAAMPSIRMGVWCEAAARLQGPGVAKSYAGTKWARVLLEGMHYFSPCAGGGVQAALDEVTESARGPVGAVAWLTQTPTRGLKNTPAVAAITSEVERRAEQALGEGEIIPGQLGAQLCAWHGTGFAEEPRSMREGMMHTFTCPEPDAARALLAATPGAAAEGCLVLKPGPLGTYLGRGGAPSRHRGSSPSRQRGEP